MAENDRDKDDTIASASLEEDTSGGTEKKVCANCGTTVDSTDWTPTVATLDHDGDGTDDVIVFLFCADDCRESWQLE